MMNIKNKQQLEKYFNNNQKTILFPILADLYKEENNFDEAKRICEIGLKHNPNNSRGLFVLALTNIAQGKLTAGERLLKKVLIQDPEHYNAAVNLAKIQTRLKRAKSTIEKAWKKVLEIDPTNQLAKGYLKHLEDDSTIHVTKKSKPELKTITKARTKSSTKIKPKKRSFPKHQSTIRKSQATNTSTQQQRIKEDELKMLDISPRMATFTMVNVLKKQKLYQQSLRVLKMLEEKGADSALVTQERQSLKKLIKENK